MGQSRVAMKHRHVRPVLHRDIEAQHRFHAPLGLVPGDQHVFPGAGPCHQLVDLVRLYCHPHTIPNRLHKGGVEAPQIAGEKEQVVPASGALPLGEDLRNTRGVRVAMLICLGVTFTWGLIVARLICGQEEEVSRLPGYFGTTPTEKPPHEVGAGLALGHLGPAHKAVTDEVLIIREVVGVDLQGGIVTIMGAKTQQLLVEGEASAEELPVTPILRLNLRGERHELAEHAAGLFGAFLLLVFCDAPQ
mmetsp:Transcript_36232/g.79087  ORF Transcript_36232/g.79087 Transcript_36232/m.79087 type:complete len:247 (-) Transcript_36232:609-1349(-)|eukprot:CAMPEP_0204440520 /NCGR_PEP_ID=MMETSP0470-20130426/83405_1 /ASSEMBLY_ACC=CAM_ASM_000385 /TAXON_ID=2969 /ORGANISM="Oxyrrhis marina" /LENGTH=246 /DNA_ID=CAMNT_0051439533 /DNA_START=484 /DNA_END=1224 /DNA_ORIENTATION=-